MALRDGKETFTKGNLYEVKVADGADIDAIDADAGVYVSIVGGTCDVYGADTDGVPTSLANMGNLLTVNTNVGGIQPFGVVPRFVSFQENTVTVTSIISNGITIIKDHGAIS